MVAHFFAMFFLWVGKGWFDMVNAGMVVLLLLAIQWIALGGRVTAKLSPFITALSFFCIWAFTFGFGSVMFWVAGACNYLWTSVFLLLFLIPYVRHYVTGGQVSYPAWFGPLWFVLGLLAGNSNENTICWIGLSGGLYLLYAWKKKTLSAWMLWGLIGLGIGYLALMLAPGNVVRFHAEFGAHRPLIVLHRSHWLVLGVAFAMQILMWFYLFKVWRRKKRLMEGGLNLKYFHLAAWFGIIGLLFDLLMLLSPRLPARSLFPQLVFLTIAVVILSTWSEKLHTPVLDKNAFRVLYGLGILYMIFTGGISLMMYGQQYQYMQRVWQQAEGLRGKGRVLVISTILPASDFRWMLMSGMHSVNPSMANDDNNWKNVAFARYFGLKGVHVVYPVKDEN